MGVSKRGNYLSPANRSSASRQKNRGRGEERYFKELEAEGNDPHLLWVGASREQQPEGHVYRNLGLKGRKYVSSGGLWGEVKGKPRSLILGGLSGPNRTWCRKRNGKTRSLLCFLDIHIRQKVEEGKMGESWAGDQDATTVSADCSRMFISRSRGMTRKSGGRGDSAP